MQHDKLLNLLRSGCCIRMPYCCRCGLQCCDCGPDNGTRPTWMRNRSLTTSQHLCQGRRNYRWDGVCRPEGEGITIRLKLLCTPEGEPNAL